MVTEALIDFFFAIAEKALGLLPSFNWSVNNSVFDAAINVLRGIFYLLPMGTVIVILGIIVALANFRIIIAVVRMILRFIPFFDGG